MTSSSPSRARPGPAVDRADVLARIRAVRGELETLGVRSVRLFGSAARDELGPGSDVDVLAVFEETPSLRTFVGALWLLERTVGRRVDLLTPGALDARLRDQIACDLVDAA